MFGTGLKLQEKVG